MLEKRVKQQWILLDLDMPQRGDIDHRWRGVCEHRRQCRQRLSVDADGQGRQQGRRRQGNSGKHEE
jgi:hypothetical protein